MRKMPSQRVSVVREKLAACMRCGICDKLMRQATTISECMHHFCRRCIYKKITVEEVENCPVCSVHLGADPLEKLRPDHNLRELRAKIFGSKKLEAQSDNDEPEALSEFNVRRRERSLSSLGANIPKQMSESVLTGKRMIHQTRKSRYLQSSHLENSNKKKNNYLNDLHAYSSSSEDKNNAPEENSEDEWPLAQKATMDENGKSTHKSDDIWNPLNFLVEVANKTKPVKTEKPSPSDEEVRVRKRRMKEYNPSTSLDNTSQFTNQKRSLKVHAKKIPEVPICIIPSPSFSEKPCSMESKNGVLWLQLLATENQGTDMPFPQIPTSYLRIKDWSMTISYVRKYIMQKLNIDNEDEIEIACMGQPLLPSTPLADVVSTWLQPTGTPAKIKVTATSSAKDFIKVLTYTRKVPTPPPPAPSTSSLSFLQL